MTQINKFKCKRLQRSDNWNCAEQRHSFLESRIREFVCRTFAGERSKLRGQEPIAKEFRYGWGECCQRWRGNSWQGKKRSMAATQQQEAGVADQIKRRVRGPRSYPAESESKRNSQPLSRGIGRTVKARAEQQERHVYRYFRFLHEFWVFWGKTGRVVEKCHFMPWKNWFPNALSQVGCFFFKFGQSRGK